MRFLRSWCRLILGVALMTGWSIGTAMGARRRSAPERPAYRARRQRGGARIFCRVAGLHVTHAGPTPPEGPMLYVSNHITGLDPIMIGTCVTVAFAGKVEITSWPLLGWIANTHGIIGVERNRRSSARMFVEAIRGRLASNVPVMVFPEGGISWGDTLLSFKTSAFEAVADTDTGRVMPIFMDVMAVDGQPTPDYEGRYLLSYNHHPTLVGHLMHVLSFRRIEVEVRFGTPFSAASRKRKALAERTHAAVASLQQKKHSDARRGI